MSDPRYPIGRFDASEPVTPERVFRALDDMSTMPAALRDAVRGLTAEQMETPHRPDGWCPRQIAHHVPDSHMNGYVRMKLALTEDAPVIKPYDQQRWAELGDSRDAPVEASLVLLEQLHTRWVALGRSLDQAAWKRTFRHPENSSSTALDLHICIYAWHGRHHLAQITALRTRMGWR